MTTILGLKTTIGKEAIVLASDRQLSIVGRDIYGNRHPVEELDFKKLYAQENFAFAMAGAAFPGLMDFWKQLKIKNPENPDFIDLEKILVDGGTFEEIRQTNLEAAAGNFFELEENSQAHFMFATNFGGTPRLHHVYPLGAVQEIDASFALGSGTEYIEDRLSEGYKGGTLGGSQVDLPKAVRLAEECITLSRNDPYSGGTMPDIAVITADSIKYYGDELVSNYQKFKKAEMEKIISENS